jgi:hypothetical protein
LRKMPANLQLRGDAEASVVAEIAANPRSRCEELLVGNPARPSGVASE